MPGIYLNNNVGVKIATVDISSYITGAVLTQTFDELEITAMGSTSTFHQFTKGLESATLQLDFLNDWAASQVMATLNTAYGTTVAVSMITVKGTVVSATNPSYQFSILVNNLTPVGTGGVGDMATSSISFTVNSAVVVSPTVAF
jgi:hypothetical protein